MTRTRELVRDLEGFRGEAKLWRVTPAVKWGNHYQGDAGGETEYIVSSAVVAMFSGPETYLFPADADGEVLDWSELPGSYRGGLSHDAAMDGLGDDTSDEDFDDWEDTT